jgi:hypothetical protein
MIAIDAVKRPPPPGRSPEQHAEDERMGLPYKLAMEREFRELLEEVNSGVVVEAGPRSQVSTTSVNSPEQPSSLSPREDQGKSISTSEPPVNLKPDAPAKPKVRRCLGCGDVLQDPKGRCPACYARGGGGGFTAGGSEAGWWK